jgi:hypothetical protein
LAYVRRVRRSRARFQPRDPLTMQGGTTFTFVTDGIHAALDQARKAE